MCKLSLLAVVLAATSSSSFQQGLAQAPASTPAPAANRIVGALVKVDGMKLTLKDQQGAESTVTLGDTTRIVRIAPGQTSMAGATPIQLTDLQPGDRLLVRTAPAADGSLNATVVVAMKQADIAQQQAQAQTAWQHGVGGIVKSVDAASRTVTVAAGSAAETTLQLGPTTVVKRYAPESIQFEQAQPSSIDKIMPGDQLRARGTAGPEHTFKADEIIAGSFRNLSGTISSVDAQGGVVNFTDLASKQPVAVKVTNDTQLRRIDDATAEKLAATMKTAGPGAGGRPGAGGPPPGAPSGPPPGAPPNAGPAAHGDSEQGTTRRGMNESGGGGGSDLQQALTQATPIHIADLKKGDVVMVVASSGADKQLGAVTMVKGVEPLLRASPNGSAAMLSAWSVGGGAQAPAQ